jgi:hypothetical protein
MSLIGRLVTKILGFSGFATGEALCPAYETSRGSGSVQPRHGGRTRAAWRMPMMTTSFASTR